MSDELTDEERALLAAEDAKDAESVEQQEDAAPKRRGRPRKETAEPVVDVDNEANADTAPAAVGPNPAQWDGDPWGATPVQMRNG